LLPARMTHIQLLYQVNIYTKIILVIGNITLKQ
jgi:hypothetical protein